MGEVLNIIFYKLLYISICATGLGESILLIKKILKDKITPKVQMIMWFVFLIMFLIPFQIPSKISIFNILDISSISSIQQVNDNVKIEDIKIENLEIENEKIETLQISIDDNTEQTVNENINEINKNKTIKSIKYTVPFIWFAILVTGIIVYICIYIKCNNQKLEKIENGRIEKIYKKCMEKININKKIDIYKHEIIKGPALFGIVKPYIIMNDEILELGDKNIEYVLLHELAHYKKRDYIINIICVILKMIFIFNPFIWYIIKQIKKDIEIATDDMVINLIETNEKKDYCRLLLDIVAKENNFVYEKVLSVSEEKSNLERRINIMKNSEKSTRIKKIITLVILAVLIILVGIFYTSEYQKETANPPRVYIMKDDGTNIEMKITSYNWNYKNENQIKKEENNFEDVNNEIFKNNEYVIECEEGDLFKATTDTEYRIERSAYEFKKYVDGKIQGTTGGDTKRRGSKDFKYICDFELGSSIKTVNIQYVKQGNVNYAIKQYTYPNNSSLIKNYLGTNINDEIKIEALVKEIKYANSLKSVNVEGNTLKLKYEFFGNDESLYSNNLQLFATIDGLEKIIYEADNTKVIENSTIKELDKLEYNKSDIEKYGGIEIQRYKNYLLKK